MSYHNRTTPNPGARVSATGSEISLITLSQDVRSHLRTSQSDERESCPHQDAETKMTDFPNEKKNFFKIMADVLALLVPLALLGFMIAVGRLGGQEVDRDTFERWQNAIRVPTESTSTVTYYDNLHASGFAGTIYASPQSQEIADAFFQYLNTLFSATLMTAETTKLDPMDHWGNVKIPFLRAPETRSQGTNTEWQELSQIPDLERYSSLAGIPVENVSSGNTTFSIESTYIELECYNITDRQTSASIDISWTWEGVTNALDITPIPANGTWEGNINSTSAGSPSWLMALNRFVDYYWVNETVQGQLVESGSIPDDEAWSAFYNSPERFMNEIGIEAGSTELLFQASFSSSIHTMPVSIGARCGVLQQYVESRISCEQRDGINTRRNCTVTAQRPSQVPHVTELISHLNFPRVWAWISEQLPRVGVFGNSYRPDMVLQYLNDPKMNNITVSNTDDMFQEIDNKVFNRRLSQILNTYLYLSQVYVSATGGGMGDSTLAPNVTLSATTTRLIEKYFIDSSWIAAGVISCAVLVIGGILSVIFRHMVAGPEVLGYASSVVRDSKYINLSFDSDKMNGLDISKMMKKQRVRYGFTDLARGGWLSVGVGLEEETTRIKDKARLS
ncbi:hypothetical protein G7054_g2509 [Neopestalotiopsis clavispora]|nr:hypothetical protein G7054_g2509 [Neopestalotiopsis clavispora]